MERHRDDLDLIAELRALRPSPRAEFSARLDALAAGGFRDDDRPASPAITGLMRRMQAIPSQRWLATVLAGALTAVAIATAVVIAGSKSGTPGAETQIAAAPRTHGNDRSQTQSSGVPPVASPAGGASARSESLAKSAVGEESAPTRPSSSASSNAPSGPYASQANHRDVTRAAAIVLGADPSDLHRDAARVFEAVHVADGIVLHSSIDDGGAGEAGASFDLLIPSGGLGDALATLSAIGEVRSRHESSEDVTAPTIGLGERLQDTRAKIESLLLQLSGATSGGERSEVEAELRRERDRAATLRSRLNTLHRRTTFSRVSVRIETGDEGTSGGAGWGLDDGLRTAGKVLAVAAGATVVGLAALVPLALACLFAALAHRAWLRRARERALSPGRGV